MGCKFCFRDEIDTIYIIRPSSDPESPQKIVGDVVQVCRKHKEELQDFIVTLLDKVEEREEPDIPPCSYCHEKIYGQVYEVPNPTDYNITDTLCERCNSWLIQFFEKNYWKGSES